jgi:GWxTD domain-containing protein
MNEALGWTLFHFLWEGAAIALLLAIILLATRSARARYAASCLAMLAMLAAFGVTLAIQAPKTETAAPVVHIPAGRLAPAPAHLPEAPTSSAPTLPYQWAVPIWVAGVVLLSLHRLMAFVSAYRLRRVGVCIAPAPWPERLARLAERLNITRPVMLLESCLIEVPAAAGYLRPAILLPVGLLAGLTAEQVEFILIHELAHIARRDYLVNLLQSVVEALLFYHPAVWWVSSVIRNEREHCCDDVVVSLAGDARGYAAALVTLEHGRVAEPALAATGGNLSRRVRRLLRQPAASQSLAGPLAAAALVVLIVSVTLAAGQPDQIAPPKVPLAHPAAPLVVAPAVAQPVLQTPTVQTEPAPPAPPYRRWLNHDIAAIVDAERPQSPAAQDNTTPLAGPYRKWLNEDVAYIISDDERRTFKSLSTDAERESFIEQFWLVRDPTPGTVENEFRQEHYRRIAYANEHFAGDIPGWKTDRGRIYITYGPPDEIEDHSNGGTYIRPAAEGGATTTVYPFQQWRYKFIESVGTNVIIEFVDSARNGEYRMTTDPSEKDAILGSTVPAPRPLPANSALTADEARLAVLQKTYKDTYPEIVRLKEKIAAERGSSNNVYVAHEPGGKVTVTVIGHMAGVSVPIPTTGTFDVVASVTDENGKVAGNLRDRVPGQPLLHPYTSSFTLKPGTYTLKILVRNIATGEINTELVTFYVTQ